jgi:hypothetical protein
MEEMVHKHCYVSQDYDRELNGFLDWTGLEDRDRVILHQVFSVLQATPVETSAVWEHGFGVHDRNDMSGRMR